jgi:hypothetical protein
MGAQEAAVEDVLRAAAAEVSTSSAKRRFRLFRHTLPLIIAKVIGTHPIIVSALVSRARSLAVVCVFWSPSRAPRSCRAHRPTLFADLDSGSRSACPDLDAPEATAESLQHAPASSA